MRVTREPEESLQREIRSTGALVEQLRTTRAQTFTMMARLIADAPELKAAVDTERPATVQDDANDYQEQFNSNLLLVTNKAGEVLATVGASPRAALVVATPAIGRKALAGRESLSLSRSRTASCSWSPCRLPSASATRTSSARSASGSCSTMRSRDS